MNEIEFKLNSSSSSNESNGNDLFEINLLKHSCYLTLNAYMIQRSALVKASSSSNDEFHAHLLNYCGNILGTFFQAQSTMLSRPMPNKEEKFILILNRLLEFYLTILYGSKSLESKVGEQVARLASLLTFYGEDSLSNQVKRHLNTIQIKLNELSKIYFNN